VADVRNIQAARGHIRRDQKLQIARPEAVQRLGAQALIQIAMDRRCVEAVALERVGHHVHIGLPIAEHDAVLHLNRTHRGAQSRAACARVSAR